MRGAALGWGLQPHFPWCPELMAVLVRVLGGEGCGFALKSQATNLGSKEEEWWGCVEIRKAEAIMLCVCSLPHCASWI